MTKLSRGSFNPPPPQPLLIEVDKQESWCLLISWWGSIVQQMRRKSVIRVWMYKLLRGQRAKWHSKRSCSYVPMAAGLYDMFCKTFHLCVPFPLIFLTTVSQPRGYRERSLSPMFENDSSHTFRLVFSIIFWLLMLVWHCTNVYCWLFCESNAFLSAYQFINDANLR